MLLTDQEIAQLDSAERLALIRRLRSGQTVDAVRRAAMRRIRRRRAVALTITGVAAGLLVPWTAYLAMHLPARYVTHAWALTWTGFDVLEIVMLGLTAFFAWQKRMLVVLTSFASGVLLLADAWIDITTANRQTVHLSVASAVFIEVPLAIFLIGMAISLACRVAGVLQALTGGRSAGLWRMPIGAGVSARDDHS